MPKETSAGAVIFRKESFFAKASEGRDSEIYYLLLHYTAKHWDFPKGHIEEGEKEEDTVKREIKEETGLEDIEIINGFKEGIKYFFRQTHKLPEARSQTKALWIFKTVTFYLAQTKTKEVKISFEHKGFKWLRYEEALKQLTFKKAKETLKKANDYLVSKKDLLSKEGVVIRNIKVEH